MADIIDRIRKLLKLAQNAGSEAEAATASARATELMREHEITEATISLSDPSTPRAPEAIDEGFNVGLGSKKRVAWKNRVVNAVAEVNGVEVYWSEVYKDVRVTLDDGLGGTKEAIKREFVEHALALFGRLTAVQTAAYISQYLFAEVERLTEEHCAGQKVPRGYRNAFRLGVATRIAKRLREAHQVHEAATPAPSAGVMVRVQQDREEVVEAFKAYGKRNGFRATRAIGQYTSQGGAYNAGKRAGDRANISSRARGGLPAGQHSLKGGK